jgi:hypothetical protein
MNIGKLQEEMTIWIPIEKQPDLIEIRFFDNLSLL